MFYPFWNRRSKFIQRTVQKYLIESRLIVDQTSMLWWRRFKLSVITYDGYTFNLVDQPLVLSFGLLWMKGLHKNISLNMRLYIFTLIPIYGYGRGQAVWTIDYSMNHYDVFSISITYTLKFENCKRNISFGCTLFW